MQDSPRIRAFSDAVASGASILIEELWNSPKACLAALAQKITGKHIVILTGGSLEESRLYHDFAYFTDRKVYDLPSWETLPTDEVPPSPDIVGERYKVLKELVEAKEPLIILTSLQAALQRLIPKQHFITHYLTLKTGQTFPFDKLLEKLIEMGYRRETVASDKGEFAVRGGILDIFPVSTPDPYRIEFWGDEIESMRTYDPVGQKSIQPATQIEIPPAQELELLKRSDSQTLFDYFGENTLIIFDDLLSLEDRYANLVSMGGTKSSSFSSVEELLDQVSSLQTFYWSNEPIDQLSQIKLLDKQKGSFYAEDAPLYLIEFELFNRTLQAKRWPNPFITIGDYLLPDYPQDREITGPEILMALPKLQGLDCQLHILCPSPLEESNFLEKKIALPKNTKISLNYLSSGLVLPDLKLIVLPLTEITGRYKIKRQKQRSTYHSVPSEMFELAPGEAVVHLNNGIGIYLGLEKKQDHNGVIGEFFQIEYADNAKLFVPINQSYLITKYIGSRDEVPKLHTIGSNKWKKTREHTEKAIVGYANDLLELYATRSVKKGFAYAPDSPDMRAFEEDFPFIETEDQLSAIASIKEDMISSQSMDRLICGDVGYGKTEVAMRAAFKAIVDGHKQVAVLVPTTVLAMQHYENFIERMSNFPVNITVLSRFRTGKQTKEALAGIEASRFRRRARRPRGSQKRGARRREWWSGGSCDG